MADPDPASAATSRNPILRVEDAERAAHERGSYRAAGAKAPDLLHGVGRLGGGLDSPKPEAEA